MKKLLLGSAAIAGLVLASAPAQAQMELTIGGHSKNYVGWSDQDEPIGTDVRAVDMQRETELHVNGESTLDNGLAFGFQVEMEVDSGDGANAIEESYIYMSGTWGRINAGSENGASYLLQVSAPSADSNIDGIRQYINPVNVASLPTAAAVAGSWMAGTPSGSADTDGLDYDNDLTGFAEKLTYLSPNWNGFQLGGSYTFDASVADGAGQSWNPVGVGFTASPLNAADEAYEVAGRYEGVVSNLGYAFGAGYTEVNTPGDNLAEWNVGLDVDAGPFGMGAVYTEGDYGTATRETVETIVVGVDYTTGPFKFGASYLTQADELGAGTTDLDTDRYTGGVIYTAGPGLSFRGSISQVNQDFGATDGDTTSVMGGVQVNF